MANQISRFNDNKIAKPRFHHYKFRLNVSRLNPVFFRTDEITV